MITVEVDGEKKRLAEECQVYRRSVVSPGHTEDFTPAVLNIDGTNLLRRDYDGITFELNGWLIDEFGIDVVNDRDALDVVEVTAEVEI